MKQRVFVPALLIAGVVATAAQANPVVDSATLFATAPAGATGPDAVAVGAGSLWVQFGNGADSTGAGGSSTIARYNLGNGALQTTFSISGNVDGLRYNPTSGQVWALQNQDGNATLSLINPATNTVSAPLSYAAPPYVYGPNSGRGYDDVAFAGGKVFLSYTNPAAPTDPVLQVLNNGNFPSGTLTTTNILTAAQTIATGDPTDLPDTDSLLATPGGGLVQTAEGDGPGSGSTGRFTLISNPGTLSQSVTNVQVHDAAGDNVYSMDDVVIPGATSGTFYLTDADGIFKVDVSGLDPNAPLASLAGFNLPGGADPSQVSHVPQIDVVGPDGLATPFITNADVPGSFTLGAFVADVPEPASAAAILPALAALIGLRRRR